MIKNNRLPDLTGEPAEDVEMLWDFLYQVIEEIDVHLEVLEETLRRIEEGI